MSYAINRVRKSRFGSRHMIALLLPQKRCITFPVRDSFRIPRKLRVLHWIIRSSLVLGDGGAVAGEENTYLIRLLFSYPSFIKQRRGNRWKLFVTIEFLWRRRGTYRFTRRRSETTLYVRLSAISFSTINLTSFGSFYTMKRKHKTIDDNIIVLKHNFRAQ